MISNVSISKDFDLYSFLHSDTAERNKDLRIKQYSIDSIVLSEIKKTAELLQNIKDSFISSHGFNEKEISFRITSGYRSKDLNKVIGGSKTSDHMFGRAVDFKVYNKGVEFSSKEYILLFKHILKNFKFYQLIKEFGDVCRPAWVHLSQREGNFKNEILEIGAFTKNTYRILNIELWEQRCIK